MQFCRKVLCQPCSARVTSPEEDMEYKMGSCIGISQRQVSRRRRGSPRWGRVQLQREHQEAFRSSQGVWEKGGLLHVWRKRRGDSASAPGKWCANRCRMGGVLLRADNADVMSSGVWVLRSLGDTAEAEWRGEWDLEAATLCQKQIKPALFIGLKTSPPSPKALQSAGSGLW